jgi:diguanylate cyclase (GGDEF)-like protein/PAS domain S-box-containing protein
MYIVTACFSITSSVCVLFLYWYLGGDRSYLGWLFSALMVMTVSSFVTVFMVLKYCQGHFDVMGNLLNNMSDIIVVKDFDGKFVFCNDRVAQLYASTPAEMIGKDDFDFIHNKEQADFFRNNVQEIMTRFEKDHVYETSTDAKTGQLRHFKSTKIPYQDVDNNLKIFIVAQDITDIVSLKEEADRDKARLEHVLDVSEEGLWEWNTATNEVLHNRRWEEITGIESSDNSFEEFVLSIVEEDRQLVNDALEALINENKQYSIEFRIRRTDNRVVWVWDRGRVASFDENNRPLWIVGIALDITLEKHNQEKIFKLAYYDQLTGLVNRAQLQRELENTIITSSEQACFSGLLFLDLDRFKLLNDSYGHHMGDRLLEIVAQRLNDLKQTDTVISRFGGDEFVVVLPLLDSDQQLAAEKAQDQANQYIEAISRPINLKNEHQEIDIEYTITASAGGVVFKSKEVTSETLLQLADIALYRAKATGGHSALIFDTDKQSELAHSSKIPKEMLESIANGDFCIYLQPKYDMDESITGAEALIRWNHPQLGLLNPNDFIGVAEESNLILPIGQFVLEQACAKLKEWQTSELSKHLKIAINLSAKQIWQSQFVEEFIDVIKRYDINPAQLIVEVTESVLIQDINDARTKLTQLKEFGVLLSLDDFGTGYSSLNYLRNLPIDEIKIDRSFIQDSVDNKQAKVMIKAIIDLAHNFDLLVVAEGVETGEQLALLKRYCVSQYQGFYFSKPLPVSDFEQLLLNRPE